MTLVINVKGFNSCQIRNR